MGMSFKKFGKTLTKAVKNPGNVLKKAVVVATGAATGLVTGGPLGAVAGAGAGVIKASKTGKAPALNLRTGYQTAIAGGAAGFAAGVAKTAVTKAGGFKGLIAKGGSFVKGGGLAKNAGKWATTLAAGAAAFGGKATEAVKSFSVDDVGSFKAEIDKVTGKLRGTFDEDAALAAGEQPAAPRVWGWKPIAAISAAAVGLFFLAKPAKR